MQNGAYCVGERKSSTIFTRVLDSGSWLSLTLNGLVVFDLTSRGCFATCRFHFDTLHSHRCNGQSNRVHRVHLLLPSRQSIVLGYGIRIADRNFISLGYSCWWRTRVRFWEKARAVSKLWSATVDNTKRYRRHRARIANILDLDHILAILEASDTPVTRESEFCKSKSQVETKCIGAFFSLRTRSFSTCVLFLRVAGYRDVIKFEERRFISKIIYIGVGTQRFPEIEFVFR